MRTDQAYVVAERLHGLEAQAQQERRKLQEDEAALAREEGEIKQLRAKEGHEREELATSQRRLEHATQGRFLPDLPGY